MLLLEYGYLSIKMYTSKLQRLRNTTCRGDKSKMFGLKLFRLEVNRGETSGMYGLAMVMRYISKLKITFFSMKFVGITK